MSVPRPAVRVLVVDDQAEVRDGLVRLLDLLPGVSVAGAAADGRAAIEAVGRTAPDVVLMDLRMPELDGVAATRAIVAGWPHVPVVVLTTYRDDESIASALAAGARGYLTKDATADELAHAVALVHDGGFVLGRNVAIPKPPARPALLAPPTPLTDREAEVLALIAAGCSNTEIGQRLHLGQATVKTHINRLFAKLGVRDRAQAVVWAFTSGWADPPGARPGPLPGTPPDDQPLG